MQLLDRVEVRYALIFVFTLISWTFAPPPVPWLGAAMWVMAGLAAWRLVNDRETAIRTGLQFVAAYAGAILFYRVLAWGLNLSPLVEELGVSPTYAGEAATGWARNVALTVFGASFLIPVYFGVWWFQAMFWHRVSLFFKPTTTVEEGQAIIKRGGRR